MNVNGDENLMRPEKLIDIWDPTNTVADYEHWKKVNIKETIDVNLPQWGKRHEQDEPKNINC